MTAPVWARHTPAPGRAAAGRVPRSSEPAPCILYPALELACVVPHQMCHALGGMLGSGAGGGEQAKGQSLPSAQCMAQWEEGPACSHQVRTRVPEGAAGGWGAPAAQLDSLDSHFGSTTLWLCDPGTLLDLSEPTFLICKNSDEHGIAGKTE